ncbi:MAG: hypothetical protein ABWY51_06350, partial [Gaiellaceae bacterium]
MVDRDLIDANLVNRLTDLARDANDEVPECETWETAIELQADQQLILVAADGGISGTLDAVE